MESDGSFFIYWALLSLVTDMLLTKSLHTGLRVLFPRVFEIHQWKIAWSWTVPPSLLNVAFLHAISQLRPWRIWRRKSSWVCHCCVCGKPMLTLCNTLYFAVSFRIICHCHNTLWRPFRRMGTTVANCVRICYPWSVSGIIVIKYYSDIIMSTTTSEITCLTIVYSTVYLGADQRKHQSSASLAFARKMFSFDDVIMRDTGKCKMWTYHLHELACIYPCSSGNIVYPNIWLKYKQRMKAESFFLVKTIVEEIKQFHQQCDGKINFSFLHSFSLRWSVSPLEPLSRMNIGMDSANERRQYTVTGPLIDLFHNNFPLAVRSPNTVN